MSKYHAILSSKSLCEVYGIPYDEVYARKLICKYTDIYQNEVEKKNDKELNHKIKVIKSLTVEDLRKHNPDIVKEIIGFTEKIESVIPLLKDITKVWTS
jgi:hypothetical protein